MVRTDPGELVFSSAAACKDIYIRQGTGSGSRPALPKSAISYGTPAGGVHSILAVLNDADHSRYRRILSHAFSDGALQEQAPLVKKYVDAKLHENSSKGPQDMLSWFNFVAFGIIGDLTLGESFDCLQQSGYHY